jgi:ribose transport system substrate-binding protein
MEMNERKQFVLSLITQENDYQMEEAAEAERVAQQLGLDLKVLYADNDAVTQSQQLLEEIYRRSGRPDAVIVQPVGTSLGQVAHAAVSAGIGWAVLNRDAEYLDELRRANRAPVLEVTTDHVEMGRIQGRQMAALLPEGGMCLYLEGPGMSPTAQKRKQGMLETKPEKLQLRTVKCQWGRHHAVTAIDSWLRLSTSHEVKVGLVAAQSDSQAMGARDAFQAIQDAAERLRWISLPFLGCDGCKNSGEIWTDKGLLRATVRIPILSGVAIKLLSQSLMGRPVEARTTLMPESYPAIERLKGRAFEVALN